MHDGVLFSFERSCGALAQLGERLLCTQEVSGSIPLGSIESKDSSIVGRVSLNHRVRDGNGCDPDAHRHRNI